MSIIEIFNITRMKHNAVGKNQNMIKNEPDSLLEAVRENLKDEFVKTAYSFQLKGRDVKVLFSDNRNARTIEEVLVKIAIGRMG